MSSYNKVFLMGNLTRDPEVRQLPSGTSVCAFGLAVNRRYRTAQGEDREETCFVDIETFGRQAETCGRYLRKGSPALVEGRLKQDRWKDRESGAQRSKMLVHAVRVQFLGASGGNDERPQAAAATTSSNTGPREEVRDQTARPADQKQQGDEPDMPVFEPIEPTDDDIPF